MAKKHPLFKFVRCSGCPERRWLWYVSDQAKCVWIWVPGLFNATRWCGTIQTNELITTNLEHQLREVSPCRRHQVAFLLFQPNQATSRDTMPVRYAEGDELFGRWRYLNRHGFKIQYMMYRIKKRMPTMPIGLVLEDFAARWYVSDSHDIRADYLVLDTPMLSRAEAERHRSKFDCPGILRRSPMSRLTPWRWRFRWAMPFDIEDACWSHLPESPEEQVGVWRGDYRENRFKDQWRDNVLPLMLGDPE